MIKGEMRACRQDGFEQLRARRPLDCKMEQDATGNIECACSATGLMLCSGLLMTELTTGGADCHRQCSSGRSGRLRLTCSRSAVYFLRMMRSGGKEYAEGGASAPPPMPESGISCRRKSVMNWHVAASSSNLRVSTHRAVQLQAEGQTDRATGWAGRWKETPKGADGQTNKNRQKQ